MMVLVAFQGAAAQALTPEQKEVVAFMKNLYSQPYKKFERGEFNGKWEPKNHCDFLKQIFTEDALVKKFDKGPDWKTTIICNSGNFRYPGSDDGDLYQDDIPTPKIQTPTVKGDLGTVCITPAKAEVG
jgi:hypothetical protein